LTTSRLARTGRIFTSRLATLARLLETAGEQWRDAGGLDMLLQARLAEDMFPLPYQIVFTCDQPNQFAAWCLGESFVRTDPATLGWSQLTAHIAATAAYVERATGTADDAALDRDRRVDLIDGMYLELSGADYVDEWLMPNFYFHLVTAYDLLRMKGIRIGKADYMAHLVDRIQRQA